MNDQTISRTQLAKGSSTVINLLSTNIQTDQIILKNTYQLEMSPIHKFEQYNLVKFSYKSETTVTTTVPAKFLKDNYHNDHINMKVT